MALLTLEGFDTHANLASLAATGWSFGGSSALSAAGGTKGTKALDVTGGSHDAYMPLRPDFAGMTELFYGFAFIPTTFGTNPFYTTLMNASNGGVLSLFIRQTSLQVLRSSVVLAEYTFARALQVGARSYFEFHVVISDSGGVVEVRKDGVSLGTLTGVDTQDQSGPATKIWFASNSSANTSGYIDDIYVCDASGAAPYNTFLGNIACKKVELAGAGTHQDFVASAGTAIAVLTDEDADADYIGATAVGARSDFTLPAIASGQTILAARLVARMAIDDVGSKDVKLGFTSGGTDGAATKAVAVQTFGTHQHLQTLDPANGLAWTPTSLAAALPFVEVAS